MHSFTAPIKTALSLSNCHRSNANCHGPPYHLGTIEVHIDPWRAVQHQLAWPRDPKRALFPLALWWAKLGLPVVATMRHSRPGSRWTFFLCMGPLTLPNPWWASGVKSPGAPDQFPYGALTVRTVPFSGWHGLVKNRNFGVTSIDH